MKLSTAALACMDHLTLAAIMPSLTKHEVAAINSLRGGDQTGAVARKKIHAAVRKQFEQTQTLRASIFQYAKARFAKQQETQPMTTSADSLLEERIGKSRDTQAMLRDAIAKYAQQHPGATKQDCIDKVLLGPVVKEMVENERRLDELAKADNTLPKHRATADIDFSQPGVRGKTGYDASVADTHPQQPHGSGGPQSNYDPETVIRDHHELLADIASGKVTENDPKFKALRQLEMKGLYERKRLSHELRLHRECSSPCTPCAGAPWAAAVYLRFLPPLPY
jgi:hypothetical protein